MHARYTYVMAANFMSPLLWRRVSSRFGGLVRHRRWLPPGAFDITGSLQSRSSAGFREVTSSSHDISQADREFLREFRDFLRSRPIAMGANASASLKEKRRPRARRAEGASKAVSGAGVVFPRPSSVAFDKELVNTVHLIGRLGRDVKAASVAGGRLVAKVDLAVVQFIGEPPSWFNLVFWNQFAMIAEQHLKKGDLVRVTGKVTVDTYLENDYVKVLVLDLKYVHYGMQSAEKESALSRRSDEGNKKNVQKTVRKRKDHPQPAARRVFKVRPKKEQVLIESGHSMDNLEIMALEPVQNGTNSTTSRHSGNYGWEAFKRYCKQKWHHGMLGL
ncbi:hypothetical protein KC19_11G152900 [Ceratodon purpureus]|uniref:Uncharacterized protein n=1 Tax=Ceratodon purpureus TaxID=3225 RepID=A0A8T0GFE6_CERPU|nr:hypothetical protein KC19_11G152900 [Ceratodon purpureus]